MAEHSENCPGCGVGPIYGVRLLDSLPLSGGMRQALPGVADLLTAKNRGYTRLVAGYETLLSRHYALRAENRQLQAVVDALTAAELSQCAWEDGEDIVLLNGEPTGGTITKHRREFDRWWPAVKRALLAATPKQED